MNVMPLILVLVWRKKDCVRKLLASINFDRSILPVTPSFFKQKMAMSGYGILEARHNVDLINLD